MKYDKDVLEDGRDTLEDGRDMLEDGKDMSEDLCTGGLIWTAHGSHPRNDNQSIEDGTKRGDANNNRRNSRVDSPKVQGKPTAEQ